jgi:hypothetical protein
MTYALFEVTYGLIPGEPLPARVIVPIFLLVNVIDTIKGGPFKYYDLYGVNSVDLAQNVDGTLLEKWIKKKKKWVKMCWGMHCPSHMMPVFGCPDNTKSKIIEQLKKSESLKHNI